MIHSFSTRARLAAIFTVLTLVILPWATANSQTPDAIETPAITEIPTQVIEPTQTPIPTEIIVPTEVVVPTATEIPAPTAVPTETLVPTEVVVPTATDVPSTTEPASSETPVETEVPTVAPTSTVDDSESNEDSTPTTETVEPTKQPVPDAVEVSGTNTLTIVPGSHVDISVQYTVGSDRSSTDIKAELGSLRGDSMTDWTIVPLVRADTLARLDGDPQLNVAQVTVSDQITQGDVIDAQWRITAPKHIENPAVLQVTFAGTIHAKTGDSGGANGLNLIALTATASLHSPTMTCVAGTEDNSGVCTVDAQHPGAVPADISASLPEGWSLDVNDMQLSDVPLPITSDALGKGAFTFKAEATSCPDSSKANVAKIQVSFRYPSGEVASVATDYALDFHQPASSFEVAAFTLNDIADVGDLSTTGQLTMKYTGGPCAWQAKLEFGELSSERFVVTDAVISIVQVDGLDGANVTVQDNSITIVSPDSDTFAANGEFTIQIQIDLPHLIPTGIYVIGVTTNFNWLDEI